MLQGSRTSLKRSICLAKLQKGKKSHISRFGKNYVEATKASKTHRLITTQVYVWLWQQVNYKLAETQLHVILAIRSRLTEYSHLDKAEFIAQSKYRAQENHWWLLKLLLIVHWPKQVTWPSLGKQGWDVKSSFRERWQIKNNTKHNLVQSPILFINICFPLFWT